MFTTKVKVFFYDADPAGIIFYASLFKFAHSAYEEFMRSLKTEKNFFFDRDYVLPIIHAEADYLQPVKPGDELKVKLTVSQLKKSSFELSYTFYNSTRKIVAKAKTVHVCADKKKFEKIELPAGLYRKLAGHS